MLSLDISTYSIQLEQQQLGLKPQWMEVLLLAATRSQTSEPLLTLDNIGQLPNWHGYSSNPSIHAALAREHKKWQQHFGLPLLVGHFGKQFRLNPNIPVRFVQPLEEIKQHLTPKTPTIYALENHDTEAQVQLMLGQLSIERGQLEAAKSAFQKALQTNACENIKLEILFYQARALELQCQYQAAKQSLEQLWQIIQTKKTLESRAKAWYKIGTARIQLRLEDYPNAQKNFLSAKKHLKAHHHREHGMIHSGLRRIAYHTGSLPDALKHAEAALEHYHQAGWTWAVQAALNDCGTIYRKRCELIWENQNSRARQHLTLALRYFSLCAEQCAVAGIGQDSAAVEINLLWCYRKQEDFETARSWAEKAVQIATRAGNQNDQAWALAEYAELEVQLGAVLEAANKFHQAFNIFDAIGLIGPRNHVRRRLEEVLSMR